MERIFGFVCVCVRMSAAVYNGVAFRLGSVKMNLIWSRLRWKRKNLLGFCRVNFVFDHYYDFTINESGLFWWVQSLIWMNECIYIICTVNHSINTVQSGRLLFPYRELLTPTLGFPDHPVRVVFIVDWPAS